MEAAKTVVHRLTVQLDQPADGLRLGLYRQPLHLHILRVHPVDPFRPEKVEEKDQHQHIGQHDRQTAPDIQHCQQQRKRPFRHHQPGQSAEQVGDEHEYKSAEGDDDIHFVVQLIAALKGVFVFEDQAVQHQLLALQVGRDRLLRHGVLRFLSAPERASCGRTSSRGSGTAWTLHRPGRGWAGRCTGGLPPTRGPSSGERPGPVHPAPAACR